MEGIMLREISHTKKNPVWSHLYVESIEQNKQQNRNKLINAGNKLTAARWERDWGVGWKRWKKIKNYKLIVMK